MRRRWWAPDPAPPAPGAAPGTRPRLTLGWLPPDTVAAFILAPLRGGPCAARNTSLSVALQDRALDNLAQVSALRAHVTPPPPAAAAAGVVVGGEWWGGRGRLCGVGR